MKSKSVTRSKGILLMLPKVEKKETIMLDSLDIDVGLICCAAWPTPPQRRGNRPWSKKAKI
jgi:hypothetical protein